MLFGLWCDTPVGKAGAVIMRTLISVLLIFSLSSSSVVFAQQTPPSVPQRQDVGDPYPVSAGMNEYVDGLRSLEHFDLPAAIDQFTSALSKATDKSDILLGRGLANLLSEKLSAGQADIQAALDLNQRNTEARRLYLFGMSMSNRGDVGRRLYNFSSQDSFDRMLQNVCGSYGSAMSQPAAVRNFDTARRAFPTVAREYARRFRQSVATGRVLYARGMDAYKQNNPELAADHLEAAAKQFPDDASILTVYGLALAAAGDREHSREVLSTALIFNPALGLAYEQRAICAARMGNLEQARRDIAVAKLLSRRDDAAANADKVLVEMQGSLPKESADALLNKLIEAANAKAPRAQLNTIAEQLVLAAHSSRVEGYETYQQRMRPLQWWTIAEPKNPDHLAALGQFILDEVDVRGDWIDPGMNWTYYRAQTKQTQQQEIERARALFKQATGINQFHVPAMMGLAKILFRENLCGDSELLVRQAMRVKPNDPEVLDYMSQLMKIAAGQAMSKALSEASTIQWTETVGNWEYRYTRYGDYAAAEADGRRADGFMSSADAYLKAALQALQDTPQSYDFIGTLAMRRKNYDTAAKAYAAAVKKVPNSIEFHYALANAYAKQNQIQQYLTEATTGRCLEQTTGSAYLQWAWRPIAEGRFDEAMSLVKQAMKVDPIDSRNLAFMGAIAEGQKQSAVAAAYFAAAIAVDQAKGRHRDASYEQATGRWRLDEIGPTVAMRMRLARIIESADPAAALALYQQNLILEPKLTAMQMVEPITGAILPEPNRSMQSQRQIPTNGGIPSMGGMLKTCRELEAVALYRLDRKQDAAASFKKLEYYNQIPALGGARRTAENPLGGSVLRTQSIAQIAVDCFREVGDIQSANRWERAAQQENRDELRRQEIPQPPQSLQPGRRGRL